MHYATSCCLSKIIIVKQTQLLIKLTFALLFSLSTASLWGQSNGNISGTIQSDAEGPLVAVNVAVRGTSQGATTNESGQFTIANLSPGTYTLDISSVGYKRHSEPVVVAAGQTAKVDITLRQTATSLSEIYVRGEALNRENNTITVDIIGQEEIQSLNIEQPLRLIEQVPGVDLVAYRQGGVADQFSIRGFGGGGHAGEAGVEIDGISLNEAEGHSDGYADLNVLIPLNLKSMKVYKGPSSVLFGRFAQGGTLALETRKGGNYQDVSVTGGSFNTFDAQVAIGKGIPLGASDHQLQTNLAFQLFRTDGYSENSETLSRPLYRD